MKKIELNFTRTDFPELGLPLSLKDPKMVTGNTSRDFKRKYKEVYSDMNMAYITDIHTKYCTMKMDIDRLYVSILIGDSSNTYRFLGMDINEDLQAVLKSPMGNIIVGDLIDSDALRKISSDNLEREENNRFKSYGVNTFELVKEVVSNMSEEDKRVLVTEIKMGKFFDLDLYGENSIRPESLINTDKVAGNSNKFLKSIILNIVRKNKIDNANNFIDDSELGNVQTLSMKTLIDSWELLVSTYNNVDMVMRCLDIWTDIYKEYQGGGVFNSSIDGKVTDEDGVNIIPDFSGYATNGSIVGSYGTSKAGIRGLNDLLGGDSGSNDSVKERIENIYRSCVDPNSVDNVYDLDYKTLASLSVIDGLRYSDDESILVPDLYNLEDEDERELLIKSTLKVYERDFSDYVLDGKKFDINTRISDVLDAQGEVDGKIIKNDYGEDITVPVLINTGDTIDSDTKYKEAIIVKDNLYKIMKLISKMCDRLIKDF